MISPNGTPPPTEDAPWQHVLANGSTPAHYIYPQAIQKSERDDREYKLIRLENGLQAMLVHDANTDKAAASLDVAIGHLSDPDDMPGLAHFCEHLLFMGTEQFPKENEYSEYLSKNGGSSNAYTAASDTNYHFSVGTKAFAGALTRFSGFFHSPLFSPSCTSRELNAVDSENKKNLQNDMWRIFQLNKHLSKPGHVWSKFGSGNKRTLTEAGRALKAKGDLAEAMARKASLSASMLPSPIPSRVASPAPSNQSSGSESESDGGAIGRETRRRLVEWWSKEYCASRMGLTLIGKESLDELTELAATLFSPVLNRGQDSAPLILDHPFGKDEMGTIVSVKTIMDFHAFELSFPIPYQGSCWRSKPGSFLAQFVGHEGPGSLHSYLKNKGWVTALNAGNQNLGRGFAMFKITVHLTKEGFQNYRSALLACYKYLSLLRSSPFPSWYHQELKAICATRFRFAEKRKPDDYATSISERLSWPYSRDAILTGPELLWDWDEQLVRGMLDGMTVDRGRVVLMAKVHEGIDQLENWAKEPCYGTDYRVQRIEEAYATEARATNDIPEMFLPGPNEFVPKNLDVDKRDASEPLKRPILIRQTSLSSLWYKKDDQFWVPKAQIMIEVRSPLVNSSARTSVMTRLYVDLVNDALTEFSYDASMAGLNYNFGSHTLGTYISVSGYNDKLHVLLRHVLHKVKDHKVSSERLAIMKEQVKLEWENFFKGQSYRISDYYGKYLLAERQWTLREKLEEISDISADELDAYIANLLSRVNMNLLMIGNLRKDEALGIADMVEEILAAKSTISAEKTSDLSLILPEACNYVWQTPVPNPDETNSSLTYYCHVGDIINPRLRATFGLLVQILSEPAFNVLRTQEQLGYIVSAAQWHNTGSLGLRVLVQSEKDPKYLEMRVDAFLASMRSVLENMDDFEFQEQKNGLIHQWNEKLKNMSEETNRFWTHIESGYLDFFRRERDAVLLQTVTRGELLALYSQYIDPSSSTRSKLSVHVVPQKVSRKFSQAAAEAFLVLLRTHKIPIDEDRYMELSASEPPISAVVAHWKNVFSQPSIQPSVDASVTQMLLGALEELGRKYPVSGEEEVKLREGTVFVEDVKTFKASLRVTEPARPVEEFHDLPVSRF